jgi:hypothetical protein
MSNDRFEVDGKIRENSDCIDSLSSRCDRIERSLELEVSSLRDQVAMWQEAYQGRDQECVSLRKRVQELEGKIDCAVVSTDYSYDDSRIDFPLLIKIYHDQPLFVDLIPYTPEIENMMRIYNSKSKVKISVIDIHRGLLDLRKDGKLPTYKGKANRKRGRYGK